MKSCFCVAATLFGLGASAITVRPGDDGRALINPGMGWMAYYYSNKPWSYSENFRGAADTCAEFPGCSAVYLRIPWALLEPEEGVFNWQAFDTPAQRWIERGGQVALRVTATENWIRYATPKWVADAGAKGIEFKMPFADDDYTSDVPLWEPHYDDSVFREKLEQFVKAMATRYDGKPYVAFVDIGTYGLWGEGHTVHTSKAPPERAFADVKWQIDLYRRYFKRTRLVLSDDVDGPWDRSGRHPILDYARSVGVTWRDDSILCLKEPNHWFHSDQAQLYWQKMPVVIETQHFWLSYFMEKAWSDALLERCVEEHHASWMSIHGDPWLVLSKASNSVSRINRRLGYRFQLRELTYPDRIKVASGKSSDGAERFSIVWRWANAGVAPCYRDAHPCLTIKDERGALLAVLSDERMNLRELPVAEAGKSEVRDHSASFALGAWLAPQVPSGEHDVFVSVGEADGTPVFELPLPDDDGHRRYKVGKIVVEH